MTFEVATPSDIPEHLASLANELADARLAMTRSLDGDDSKLDVVMGDYAVKKYRLALWSTINGIHVKGAQTNRSDEASWRIVRRYLTDEIGKQMNSPFGGIFSDLRTKAAFAVLQELSPLWGDSN